MKAKQKENFVMPWKLPKVNFNVTFMSSYIQYSYIHTHTHMHFEATLNTTYLIQEKKKLISHYWKTHFNPNLYHYPYSLSFQ